MQKRLEQKLESQEEQDEVMTKIMGLTDGTVLGMPKYKTEEFKQKIEAMELAEQQQIIKRKIKQQFQMYMSKGNHKKLVSSKIVANKNLQAKMT